MPLNDPEEEGVKPAPKAPDQPPADAEDEDSKRPREDDDSDKDSSPDNEKRARVQDNDDKNVPKGPPMPPPNFPGAMMMPYPMFGLAPPGMFAMAQAKGPAAGDNKQQDEGKPQDDDTPPNNKQPQVVMMPYPPPFMMPAFLAMQQQQRRPRSVGIGLSMACDVEQLSDYQILVRQQLELFEASQEDVESNTQGRKKPVALNQVGLRCRHCAGFALRQRGRGAVYYPSTLFGIYQAAQNMAGSHLCVACQHIPLALKQELRKLRQQRDNASGGKQYWADGCRALGIYQDEACLRLRRRPPQQEQEQEASEQQNAAKEASGEPATSSV